MQGIENPLIFAKYRNKFNIFVFGYTQKICTLVVWFKKILNLKKKKRKKKVASNHGKWYLILGLNQGLLESQFKHFPS
jgi:hypothetical protein